MTTEPALSEHWTTFLERFTARNASLIEAWTSCRSDMQNLFEARFDHLEQASAADLSHPNLATYQEARRRAAQQLLYEPVSQWERLQPYSRALIALEDYGQSLEELLLALPENLPAQSAAVIKMFGEQRPHGVRVRFGGLRRKQFMLPLRTILAFELHKSCRRRFATDGRFLFAFSTAMRQLKSHWEIVHEATDAALHGHGWPEGEVQARQAQARQSAQHLLQQAQTTLNDWRQWTEDAIQGFKRRLGANLLWHAQARPETPTIQGTAYLDFWTEQLRAVDSEIKLETALARTEDRILDLVRQSLEDFHGELAGLTVDLNDVIDWLHRQTPPYDPEGFPRSKSDVVPASSRLAELEASLLAELGTLPQSIHTLVRLAIKPGRRKRWKHLQPRETLGHALKMAGLPECALVFEEIAAEHRKILQGIERARQVVGFATEVSMTAGRRDDKVVREALQNALSLLEYYRDEPRAWPRMADARLARALAAVFKENRLVLTWRRLGIWTYLAQQGLHRALVFGTGKGLSLLGKEMQILAQAQNRAVQRFFVYIGWRPETSAGKVQVITRPYLPKEFIVAATRDLPALYRYLFHPDAVRDPRFLVGRNQEMDAIAQARALWEEGRPAAILIVGERGSGKTSLINCALKKQLRDLDVVTAEFSERLIEPSQFRHFLAHRIAAGDAAQLTSVLAARRRVVILEELERSFLRQVGCFGAIRELQRLIAASCASTLWILSVNRVAFEFLDAAVHLGQSFSHRINAGTASRDDLRQAILLRHNLSGLRAQYPEPPQPGRLRSYLSHSMQSAPNPESIYFDRLADESSGIYRTAFDLWIGQIDSIHAGALYLKPFSRLDLSAVLENLSLDQLFTLAAILQHGGLTPEEHAIVFQRSVADGRAAVDELLAREIIHTDPGRPGFRVRPEAMPIVKEVLYRRNLL